MAPYALDWLKNRFNAGGTNDVDYGSSITRGGGRPSGFNTAKYDGYMDDDNEVAMTPGQLLTAVRGATNFLNPNASPSKEAQELHDRIFGKGGGSYSSGNYGKPVNQHPGGYRGIRGDIQRFGARNLAGGVMQGALQGILDPKPETYWGGPRR